MKRLKFALALFFAVEAAPAMAGPIVGGSLLLNGGNVTTLEGWLGEGQLTLTNVYSKAIGDNGFDFHQSVDGLGRTFTAIEVFKYGQRHIIGGYNPQSWDSVSGYNVTVPLAARTAFIFNLSTTEVRYQEDGLQGEFQTYNAGSYGPTFGGGHDIWINFGLNTGYSYAWSYCNPAAADCAQNLGTPNIVGAVGIGSEDYFFDSIGGIEVFTLAPFAGDGVPGPGALALLGLGVLGLGATRRRTPR